jgi:hypothetical protein
MNGLDHYYNKFTSEDLLEKLSLPPEELPDLHRDQIKKILKYRETVKDSKNQMQS